MSGRGPALVAVVGGLLLAPASEAQLTIYPAEPSSADVVVGRLISGWSHGCSPWVAELRARHRPDGQSNDLQIEAIMELDTTGGCPSAFTGAANTIPLGRLPVGNHLLAVGLRYTSEPDTVLPWHEAEIVVAGPQPDHLALRDARFVATVTWRIPAGSDGTPERSGTGTAVPPDSDTSGLFWFFSRSNWEILVKVLDGCDVNGHHWLLGFGATDVEVDLRVLDRTRGETWQLSSTFGEPVGTFADVKAFPCEHPN